jgi:hypothetical protein
MILSWMTSELPSKMMRKMSSWHSFLDSENGLETVFIFFGFVLVEGSTVEMSRTHIYTDHQNVKETPFSMGINT